MKLNRLSLNVVGLNRIGLNQIGSPSRGSSSGTDRPYIDPEVLASLKAVCICYGKSNDDPDRAVVKNLVDPDNPFVISNAAFKLNSGFGKYEVDFTEYRSGNLIYVSRILPNSILATTDGSGEKALLAKFPSNENDDINDYKVEIKLTEGVQVVYKYIDNTGTLKRKFLNTSGIYDLPKSYISKLPSEFNDSIGFSASGVGEIYLSQIPSFEGAFVTDGIDDLITSTKTVQEMLGGSNEITVVSMAHFIKGESKEPEICRINQIRRDTRCIRNSISKIGKSGIFGYTYKNGVTTINNILGDKNDCTAEGNLDGIVAPFSVEGYYYNNNSNPLELCSIAWYWTIIANKVLTTDQINQVIAYFNLDRTLKPDILCNTIKQGITNENHAEFGDKLIDFSGNGRDIQLNNIAWKGDSGIGKYSADFESFDWAVNISQKQHNKATISLNGRLCNHTAIEVDEMKVNIIGNITELIYWYIANPDDTTRSEIRLTSGINTLPKSYAKDDGQTYNIGFAYISGDSEITIEQIPSHAGALCLDGVNDFGKVTGMPIYKDYTFIIDYERISYTSEGWGGAIVSKSPSANNGAFISMMANSAGLNKQLFSFGGVTAFIKDDLSRILFWQTKYKSENTELTVGEGVDGDTLWLGTLRDNDSRFFNGAIYSLMSFPYSMNKYLIERQLKKHKLGTLYPNMVEFRPIVKSNSEYQVVDCYIDTLPAVVGNYYPINSKLRIAVTTKGAADEVTSLTVNGVSLGTPSVNGNRFTFNGTLSDKSPQKINITIYQPPEYLTMLSNSTLISNETLIKNE